MTNAVVQVVTELLAGGIYKKLCYVIVMSISNLITVLGHCQSVSL